MAVWSYHYQKSLPDSAFLYVDAATGERKLPVLNRQGKLSRAHLKNAAARLSRANIPESAKKKIRAEILALEDMAAAGEIEVNP